ncbi:MAG: 2-polyprenyl-3-methyl-6-methoxy-1,4-benzoquinone monooxygenase [Kangiellaceae bacterium]|jgi:ubiquinone biosynthesis monooxygenase Coq7|nr:2-polyprenyl-3-methyl-6-methoxy-1,4-benzoquinone monooxygenase [Kangiellaceae bacterium]
MRKLSFVDSVVNVADNALRTIAGGYQTTSRTIPSAGVSTEQAEPMTEQQKKHAAGLMRINHCGEVCAQALYQGQALTAKLPEVRESMEQAAKEENDHLSWCQQRLSELNAKPSLLNPLWYVSSFTIGATAGLIGDKWSLGFVAETERQVVKHLSNHLEQLPEQDVASRAVLKTMREDELHHATVALEAGGAELPAVVKRVMTAMSKVMTKTVYHI